jgi:hypothetical protein
VPTSANACLIDGAIENATVAPGKSGYILVYPAPAAGYAINNNPVQPGSTGVRYFFTDQTLVIRYNAAAAATATSTPI